jgi:hypothetical protein
MKLRVARVRSRQRTSRNGCAALLLLALLASGAWAAAAPVPDSTAPTNLSVNGDAHQQVTISGVMPTTFTIRLFATYESTTPDTKNPCGRSLKGAAASVPLGVTIPLDVTQHDGSYEAAALVDKFEPGKCGWHFYGISFTVNGVGNGDFVAQFVDRVPEGDKHVKRWCGNNVFAIQATCCLLSATMGVQSTDSERRPPPGGAGASDSRRPTRQHGRRARSSNHHLIAHRFL